MDVREKIDAFLKSGPYAVVGASTNRDKYGNKVLRAFKQRALTVYPVNPREQEIEGLRCYPQLRQLPEPIRGLSVITPPPVTEQVVEELPASGARFIWMQPGAESDAAVAQAEELGLTVIAGGPCLLVTLGFRDE
jgi:predicted CoA-binding protein